MPKYAQTDNTGLVIAFYDTDRDEYPNLPPLIDLALLTDTDWEFRANNMPGPFTVTGGHLALMDKSLSVQSIEAASALRAGGLTLTSSLAPGVTGKYALDQTTLDQIGSVARDFGAGLGLPGGGGTFLYLDASGAAHSLTGAYVVKVYQAMRNFVFALTTQAAVMRAGGSPSWPSTTVVLD